MREAIILVIAMFAMVYCAVSNAQDCYNKDGELFVVPEKKKLVLVPAWVDIEKIVLDLKIAEYPEAEPQSCDELVVAPATCD